MVELRKVIIRKKQSDILKIYKTTDGFFTDNVKITKPRRVAVVDQRKDDNAVAVVTIFSKKGKTSDRFVERVTLKPKRHNSLTEKSVVENEVRIGVKDKKIITKLFILVTYRRRMIN